MCRCERLTHKKGTEAVLKNHVGVDSDGKMRYTGGISDSNIVRGVRSVYIVPNDKVGWHADVEIVYV